MNTTENQILGVSANASRLFDTFNNSSSFSGTFGFNSTPDPTNPITVTDLSSKNFHVEAPTATSSFNSDMAAGGPPPNPTEMGNQIEATKQDYLQTNAAIGEAIQDAIMEVDPENGPGVIGAIFPTQSGGAGAVAASLDPTGIGNVWEILYSAYAEAKAPNDTKINEILEKALSNLHQQTQETVFEANEGGKAKPPPPADFEKIKTVQQLREFINRDVTKDPVMQEVAKAEDAINKMQDDFDRYHANYGDKITGAKVEAAVGTELNTLVGDEVAGTLNYGDGAAAGDFVVSLFGVEVTSKDVPQADQITSEKLTAYNNSKRGTVDFSKPDLNSEPTEEFKMGSGEGISLAKPPRM